MMTTIQSDRWMPLDAEDAFLCDGADVEVDAVDGEVR